MTCNKRRKIRLLCLAGSRKGGLLTGLFRDAGFPYAQDNCKDRIRSPSWGVGYAGETREPHFHHSIAQQTLWRLLLPLVWHCVKAISLTAAGDTHEGQPQAITVDRRSPQPTCCIYKATSRKAAQQALHHGETRPLPTSREGAGNRVVVSYLHATVGSVEMPKKQFRVSLRVENPYKAATSMFSLAIKILGYYTSSLTSFSDPPPCEKACPGTTHTLSSLYYRLTSSYIMNEHPDGTLFFRFSYEDCKQLSWKSSLLPSGRADVICDCFLCV